MCSLPAAVTDHDLVQRVLFDDANEQAGPKSDDTARVQSLVCTTLPPMTSSSSGKQVIAKPHSAGVCKMMVVMSTYLRVLSIPCMVLPQPRNQATAKNMVIMKTIMPELEMSTRR
jgi:hypothetical protein